VESHTFFSRTEKLRREMRKMSEQFFWDVEREIILMSTEAITLRNQPLGKG
jgi:hypothetical protein